MVNVKEEDIFIIHNIKVAIADKNTNILFFKEGKYQKTVIEEFVELTKPLVKYLYDEGFIKQKSVKVTILAK